MPQPYDYTTRPVNVGGFFESIRQGRADRLATEEEGRQNALAKYLPGALRNEPGAREQALAVGTPDQQIALFSQFSQLDDASKAREFATLQKTAQVLYGVKKSANPQMELERAKPMLVQFGAKPEDIEALDLDDIDGILASATSLEAQIERDYKERSLALDESRTRAQIARDNAAAAKDRAALTPVIGPDGKPMPGPPNDKTIDNEAKIRGEFIKGADEFVKVRDAFGRIVASASNPSAAGDLALIFSYMKILDPGSVVREQEFANAQNAAGVPDQIRAQYNKVLRGERLAPAQRADFTNRASRLYKRQLESFGKTRGLYEGIAKEYGFAPSRTVPDLSLGVTGDELARPAPPPPRTVPPARPTQGGSPIIRTKVEFDALPSGAVYVGTDGKKYRKP